MSVEQIQTHEAEDHDEIGHDAPARPVPISCQKIEYQGEEILPEFALSPPDNALQKLRAVGKASRFLIESLRAQSDRELAIGPHSCLILLQAGLAGFPYSTVCGLSGLVLITKHLHL